MLARVLIVAHLPAALGFGNHGAGSPHCARALSLRWCRPVLVKQELPDLDVSVLPESAPDGPSQAISIVSELKANAALFAAFAFGSLNLPGTLIVSESRLSGLGGTITTSRVSDSDLVGAFVLLDALTLCLMVTCVAASQLLIYRLADGSYGAIRYSSEGGRIDRRDTALGRLVTQYKAEFRVARVSFALGLSSLLLAVAVKAVAVFDQGVALPVVAVIGAGAFFIGTFYLRAPPCARCKS